MNFFKDEELMRRLKNIDYIKNPERLLTPYGPPTDEDFENALNRFLYK